MYCMYALPMEDGPMDNETYGRSGFSTGFPVRSLHLHVISTILRRHASRDMY
jgi:hypothetical protein